MNCTSTGCVKKLGSQCSDSVRVLGFDPIQLETIGSGDTEYAVIVIQRDKRLYPRTELLGSQFQFQL